MADARMAWAAALAVVVLVVVDAAGLCVADADAENQKFSGTFTWGGRRHS